VIIAIPFILAAIGALVWGVMQMQAASSAKVRADALDERIRKADADLATAADKVAFAEQAARQSEQKAAESARRVEQSAADSRRSSEQAEEAVAKAIAAEHAASEAVTRAEKAESEIVEARRDRDATLAGAGPFQPEALWQLEVQRVQRLWRDRLALGPGEEAPLTKDSHDVGAALRVLSECSREESGVVVDLMWHVDFDIPPDRCIQLVRLGEELIAAMRLSEGGELEVIGEEDRTVFFLVRTLPPIELPQPLTDVLDAFGAMREMADSTVVLRVPARDDAKLPPAPSAEGEAQETGDDGATIDLTDKPEPEPVAVAEADSAEVIEAEADEPAEAPSPSPS
jgi:hypothetical protein